MQAQRLTAVVSKRIEILHRASWFFTFLILAGTSAAASADLIVKQFKETDETFRNPGQGWMTMQQMPPKDAGEGRFPYSLAYFRLNWLEIEPEEGKYNWHAIDNSINAWAKRGVHVSFRIMTANAHSSGYYCSPKWLFDAGCKSFDYAEKGADAMKAGSTITRIEPDYADPIYLQKHGQTIAALAKHFDGNPNIEFIDIGSYGIWGEWHTEHEVPISVRKQIIDMYTGSFHKTRLVSMTDDAEALNYALSKGTGIRRDGVGSPWHEASWIGSKKYSIVHGLADQWKIAPVVFEWYGPYDYMQQQKWNFDKAIAFIKANHVTYINDNIGQLPPDQLAKLQQLGNVAGYRLVLREISHEEKIARGGTLNVAMKWANVGVGKLYRRHPLVICLIDANGAVACQQEQCEIDTTQWLPGKAEVTATLQIPATLKPGLYTLGVALIDPDTQTPAIRLAIDAPQTERLYRVGELRVE